MNTSVQRHPSRRSETFADNLHSIKREALRDAVASQRSVGAISSFRRVLVVLDGSNCAEHAVPMAAEIARRAGAALQLAHVNLLLGTTFVERSLSFEETIGRHRQQQMRDYLEACSRRFSYDNTEVLSVALRGERRARDLEAIAGNETLIVTATRYRGVLEGFQFGSATERLLSIGSSPILFMKGYGWPVDVHAPLLIRRVLTYLDGSPNGEQIMPSASALAKATASSHTLLQVVPTLPYVGVPWEERLNEAKAYLSATVDRFFNADDANRLAIEIRSSDAPVAQVILTYAQNSKSDVIAVAARHRSKFSKLLRPDPAEYLVQYSRIPVLVTRSRMA